MPVGAGWNTPGRRSKELCRRRTIVAPAVRTYREGYNGEVISAFLFGTCRNIGRYIEEDARE